MFRNKTMLFEVASARFLSHLSENPVTEQQASFRLRFLPQSLLQHPGHEGGIAGRLLLGIDLAKDTPQFRALCQCLL